MQFFKLEGEILNENWKKEYNDRSGIHRKIKNIAAESERFNQKLHDKAWFFVSNCSEDSAEVVIIANDSRKFDDRLAAYLKRIKLSVKQTDFKEITFDALLRSLNRAEREDYIDDKDPILERFDLNAMDCYDIRHRLEENIIDEYKKSDVYNMAKKLLSDKTLMPELDRIYAGKSKTSIAGHPVHYMIQTDDRDIRKETAKLLLGALYANERLQNRRCSFLEFRPGEEFSKMAYECLYKSNIGGAVIVKYHANDDSEDDHATCGREIIEFLCEMMKKYRNRVLTVFCLPRECAESKDLFYESLGNTGFVELKEDFAYGERVEGFLKMLASEHGVRSNKKLFAKLEPDKGYLAPELRDMFDDWYTAKLKKDIYPQYSMIDSVSKEVIKAKPRGSAYDELMEMIGLSGAKEVIHRALNYYKAQKLFADKGMQTDRPAMHMVFTGNPGTAKTSVARLFARIMKENNLLSKGKLIEVGRGDLVGKYVGWTAPIIQKKFREAQGSVLFIDEAYSLVDDRDGSFGDEAINTIVQEMENHRDDVVVIFAGYPNEMERFLQKNPGLRSRIAFHVPFADYDTAELCDIAELTAKKKGLILSDGAREKLAVVFETAREESDFGNGRYVRNMIEKAKMEQATRLLSMDFDALRKSDIQTICAEDIKLPQTQTKTYEKKIGFYA